MEGIRLGLEDADGSHQGQLGVPAFEHIVLSGSSFRATTLHLQHENILRDLPVSDDFTFKVSHNLIITL
jgi:hypothetical protein